MATKVTILGEQPIEQEKKKIEFVWRIDTSKAEKGAVKNPPAQWGNIELIKSKNTHFDFDVMLAYDDDRNCGVLYLGHFNDGIV